MAESLRDLVVSLSLDTDNFSSNIKSINAQLKEAESQFRAAGAGVDGFENTVGGAQAKLTMLEQKFKLQQQAVAQYEKALTAAQQKLERSAQTHEKLNTKLDAAKQRHAELGSQIQTLTQDMQELADEGQQNTTAYAEMEAELERLKAEYAASGTEVGKLEQQLARNQQTMQRNADAVTRAQTNLNNANANLRETQNAIDQTRSHLEQLQNTLVQAGTAMQNFGAQAQEIGKSVENVGKKMTVVSAAVVALGAKCVKTFAGYDDSIRQVYATMGLSADQNSAQMEALDAAAQQMGATTKYTASQAAEALNYLALAGYDAQKSIETLPVVLNLAQAGGIDLASASDMVTDSMSALGISTDNVTNFTDQMARAAQKSNTSVAQLGEGILTVSAVAKNLAGGTTELNTALGILADNGLKGSEGGTHLRNVILSLQNPTSDAAERLNALGISVYDAQGNMRGLDQIFSDLGNAMQGWTQQAKDAAISDIFNKTDLSAANALLANCGARWQELSGYITECDGAAQQMADTMEGGIGGSFRSLSSAVESLAIKFGESLAPMVKSIAEKITELARKFSELDSGTRQRIATIAAIVAAAGPLVLIAGKLITTVGTISTVLGKGLVAVAKIPKLFTTVTSSIGAFGSKAVSAFKSFSTAASNAGGGMSGLLTALKSSPGLYTAAAAACAYLVYKFVDFISGAKAAREAQERLNETVKQWNEDVTTAFEKSKGMDAFGLSAEDFKIDGAADEVTTWLEDTVATWTDGKKETDEILQNTVKGFTDTTDSIRTNLTELRSSTKGGMVGDLDTDIERLNQIDAEVEAILKKKQNGYLSDDEIARLQSLMDERDAIQIKYKLVEDTGDAFQSIVDGVDAALSRSADSTDTWNNAFAAATQGLGAFTDSLNESYDARYAAIQAMEDGDEKTKAMDELVAWYNAQVAAAQQQYYETLAASADKTGMFEDGGQYSDTIAKLQTINSLMLAASQKDGKSAEVTALRDALAGLDETSIVEMDAAIQAMVMAAESAGQEVPESVKAAQEALQAVKDTSITADDVFPEDVAASVKSMFSGINEESTEVYASLNCDNLATAYDAWAAGVHADIIPSITTDPIQTTLTSATFTFEATGTGDIPEGKITTPSGSVFTVDGDGNVTSATPAEGTTVTVDADGVCTYVDPNGQTFKVDGSGKLTYVDPNGKTFTVTGDGKLKHVDASGTTFFVDSGTGRVTTVITAAGTTFTVDGDGKVTSATPAKGTKVTVDADGVCTYVDPNGQTFTVDGDGVLTTLSISPNATIPEIEVKAKIVDFDAGTYSDSVTPELEFRGGLQKETTNILGLTDFTASGTYKQLELLAQAVRDYDAAVTEFGADSVNAQNCAQSIELIGDSLGKEVSYNGGMGFEAMAQTIANGLQLLSEGNLEPTDAEKLTGIITNLQTVLGNQLATDSSWADNLGTSFTEGISNALNNNEGWSTTADGLLTSLSTAFTSATTQMQTLGGDITAGIGEGMAAADTSSYATTTMTNVESDLRTAASSHSPAGLTKPLGSDVAAGIGVGMTEYSFAGNASTAASNLLSAAKGSFTSSLLKPAGQLAMRGLAQGITSGSAYVTTAIRLAAQKAVRAAKAALVIRSPSRVFRDEVGVMVMKGFGEGIIQETRNQARIIRNAAGYLTGEARGATAAAGNYDYRKTYNDSSSVNVNVETLAVSDQQSIFDLANEIAAITRRQQRGKGNRMA